MTILAGAHLGPYEITGSVGSGGMGEVYRARDSRIGRDVAIKVLPSAFTEDRERLSRFDREARAAGALNHPNLLAIYDVGLHGETPYLVSELLEGSTLRDRMAGAPLPQRKAVDYALQIASGLAAAHEKGIVHRDLKPENIFVTRDGRVKILDFGLAKVRLPAQTATQAPTAPLETDPGTVVGTAGYMSPEQVRGDRVDHRTDIFSLGAILYEMLSGKRAFHGGSSIDTMHAILHADPPALSGSNPLIAPSLERIVHHCLEKSPDERFQSARDLTFDLQSLSGDSGASQSIAARPPMTERPRPSRPSIAAAIVVVLLVSVAVAGVTWWISRRFERTERPPAPLSRVTRSTIDLRGVPQLALGNFTPMVGYFGTQVALSPDGSELVYVGWSGGDTQIFKRVLDRDAVEPVDGTRGAREAFFSPDGKWLGVITNDKVLKIPHDGGPSVVLANVRSATRGVWTKSDSIWIGDVEGLIIVHLTAQGDKVEEIDLGDVGGGQRVRFSDVLPDGGAAIVNVSTSESVSGDFSVTGLLDLKTRKLTQLLDRSYDARYVDSGMLMFVRGGDLLAIPFDATRRMTTGEPTLIASGIASESFFRRSHYAVSADGSLAYVPGGNRSRGRIAVVDRSGHQTLLNVPEQLYVHWRLSPDDHFLAAHVSDVKDYVSVFDLARQQERRLLTPQSAGDPLWRPDGEAIYALMLTPTSGLSLAELDANGGRAPRTIATIDTKFAYLIGVTPDTRRFFIVSVASNRPAILQASNIVSVQLTKGITASVSPDGKWIAFGNPLRGGYEIYVSPVENPEEIHQISTDGGLEPVWCRNCPELFYRHGDQWFASHISTSSGKFEFDAPREVWRASFVDTPGLSYEVSKDGQRLLISKRTQPDITDRIQLVRNWPVLLKKSALEK